MFIDDNFIGDIGWANAFLDAIMPLGLKWNAAVSINIAHRLDLPDKMKKSGSQILPYLMFNLFYRKFGRFTDILCRLASYKRIGIAGEILSRYLS